MKIYTRAGDDGDTHLLGAGRVPKSAVRVEAYGSVDELNAMIGAVRAQDTQGWLEERLGPIQSDLFRLGAELATVDERFLARIERIGEADVARLEGWIDAHQADLPQLDHFILPGGTPLGAQVHVARTVGRRAERRVVALAREEQVASVLIRYLNRLSDLLFVMARWSNARAGVAETRWP